MLLIVYLGPNTKTWAAVSNLCTLLLFLALLKVDID